MFSKTINIVFFTIIIVIFPIIMLSCVAATNNMAIARKQTQAPVVIGSVTKRTGKPPLVFYEFEAEFTNYRDQPIWLVMRDSGDRPLNESNVFEYGGLRDNPPFDATQYLSTPRDKGQTVLVSFTGGFKAIHLPKGAKVKFDEYIYESRKEVSQFEIWEVETLLVGGETQLEKWLPYSVMSDIDVHIVKEPLRGIEPILNWDQQSKGDRTDFPKEKVKFVTAKVLEKWTIPLKIKATT